MNSKSCALQKHRPVFLVILGRTFLNMRHHLGSVSVTDFIKIEDIDPVFDHLEKKYGYSKQWRFDCRRYMAEQSREDPKTHPVLYFLRFSTERIEPLLNAALCNPYRYAFFMRMVCWLVRDLGRGHGPKLYYSEGETY